MVDRFPTPRRNVRKVVFYNENKVKKGEASYLVAVNFRKEIDEMTAEEKIDYFLQRNQLNPACKANTPHIILSFDPSEKLSDETLIAIATAYMEGIGFGDQPYLVYNHSDTHHPHLHIVTTLIQADGIRIPTHKIGEEICEPVRIKIEEQFGLIKAQGRRNKEAIASIPVNPKKIKYGDVETYRSLAEVVQAVTSQYIFTTVGELNAILKQYNVFAETGKKGSKTAENRGLYYRILDADGKPKGVPIKASDLPGKPTLKFLEARFDQNRPRKENNLRSIRTRVEWTLRQGPKNLKEFTEVLGKEDIKAVLWQNESGWAYGITFLDLKTRTAVNGRDLGREMGISALQAQWSGNALSKSAKPQNRLPCDAPADRYFGTSAGQAAGHYSPDMGLAQLLEPYELSTRKKKKKRKPPTF
jgi:Relaxase/Mobilisation nuclease domain